MFARLNLEAVMQRRSRYSQTREREHRNTRTNDFRLIDCIIRNDFWEHLRDVVTRRETQP